MSLRVILVDAQQKPVSIWTPPVLHTRIADDELPHISDVDSTADVSTPTPTELDAEYRLVRQWRKQGNTVRPRRNFTDVVNVSMAFGLLRVNQIEEDLNVGIVHGWTLMMWDDDYHAWNASDFGGLTAVSVAADVVWKPDIVQHSGASRDSTVNIFARTKVNIMNTGRVIWTPPTTLSVPFRPLNDSSWPYDRHVITFKLGTWSQGTATVNLIPLANESALRGGVADSNEFVEGPRWKLIRFQGHEQKETFKCCPGSQISMLTFELEVERKANFLLHLIGWPLKLVLFSSCAVFVLPVPC